MFCSCFVLPAFRWSSLPRVIWVTWPCVLRHTAEFLCFTFLKGNLSLPPPPHRLDGPPPPQAGDIAVACILLCSRHTLCPPPSSRCGCDNDRCVLLFSRINLRPAFTPSPGIWHLAVVLVSGVLRVHFEWASFPFPLLASLRDAS